MATCEPEPDTLPLSIQAIDPVPAALGYFAFTVPGGTSLTGTLTLFQELRAGDDSVLASRVYTVPLSIQNVITDTVTQSQHVSEPWSIALNADAFEWSTAYWRITMPHGEAVFFGQWYADLDTPEEPGEDGAYLTREINVFRLFLPVIMK